MSSLQIKEMGLRSCGENVLISEKASIYGASKISLGNNVRIDDFCILSAGNGGITVGNYVHIACYSSIIGRGKVTMEDFSGLSSRVSIYSSSDDYSGKTLTNSTVPENYRYVDHRDVYISRHAIIGAGSVILPGVCIGEGCAVGALSLVKKNCDSFSVYYGNPAKKIKERFRDHLEIEKNFLEELNIEK